MTMDGIAHDVPSWDMIIAFVPCTKTSNAGARHLYKGEESSIFPGIMRDCAERRFFLPCGQLIAKKL